MICAPAVTLSSASERFVSSMFFCDHVVDQRMAGQLLIGAVDHVVALGPASDRGEIDVDHHRDEVAAVAVGHRLADVGIELQLVLDVLRREQRAVLELADILGAVDDLQMPGLAVEEAGVAGLHVAVRRHRLLGLGVVLEVADEHAGRLELHLAVVGDADIDVRQRGPDGVGVDLSVRLRGEIEEGFGLAVELLQVHAERAVEREQVRPDRLAGGVGDAHAARGRARSSAGHRPGCCRASRAAGRCSGTGSPLRIFSP